MAAYIDGNLNRQQSADFESECWTDTALLAEVVAVYDSLFHVSLEGHENDKLVEISRRSTRRLIELFPDAYANTAVKSNGAIETMIEPPAPENKIANLQLDAGDNGSHGHGRSPFPVIETRAREKYSKRGWFWLTLTAASLIIAISVAGVYWSKSRPNQTISGETGGSGNPDESKFETDDADNRFPGQDTPDNTRHLPIEPQLAIDDSTSPPATELAPQELGPSGNRDSVGQLNPSPNNLGANPASENDPNLTPESLDRLFYLRKKLEGLVATHDPTSRHWLGVLADSQTFDSRAFHVFPASRLRIGIGEMAEITADENTRFRLNPPGLVDLGGANSSERVNARSMLLDLELEAGSVAVRNLNSGSQTTVTINHNSYLISINEPDSLFVITWQQDTPSLSIIAGSVDIRSVENPDIKRTIAAGQFLELAVAPLPAAQAAINVLDWFEKPVARNAVPRRDLDRLLASDRLVSDLESLVQSNNRQQRSWSNLVLAQMEPEDHLIAALNHTDARIRLPSTHWLLQIPGNSPLVLPIWRQLATLSDQPEWARTAVRLRQPHRSGVAVTATDIPPLLEGLVSPHLAIRQVSAVVLEQQFGNPAGYQPDATPVFLEQKRQEWGIWIRRSLQSRPAR